MSGVRGLRAQRGFTLIELLVAVLIVALLSAGAVIAFAPAEEAPVDVSMVGDIETFAALEARAYHVAGAYEDPREMLASGMMDLSPGVEVDSAAFAPERVYLRVRHRGSPSRCSIDLSEASRNATNRVRCFGGTGRDSTERVGVADGPLAPGADTTAGVVPPTPFTADVVLAPHVEDPADASVAPGEPVDRSFIVTNRSAVARRYRFHFVSTDPALVAVPSDPSPATLAAGSTLAIGFVSSMATDAAAGRLSAITLDVVDVEEDALAGQGTFAAMAAVHVEAALVESSGGAEVPPGDTVALTWTVTSRSNIGRMVDVAVGAASPALTLVSAEGLGRVRFEPGEVRRVVTVYRLSVPSSAGSIGSVSLGASDAGAPQLRSTARSDVSTALVVAAPLLQAPPDTTVEAGATFTRVWSIAARTNASRSYVLDPTASGTGIESFRLVGPAAVTIPENGSAQVVVEYRARSDAAAGAFSTLRMSVRDAEGGGDTGAVAAATIALTPVAPVVSAPPSSSGYVGDTAVMTFAVRNPGNGTRRYAISAASADPGVAMVKGFPADVDVPALGAVDVPVVVEFPGGAVVRLETAVSVEVRDAGSPSLSGAASAQAVRLNRAPTVRVAGPGRQVAAGEDVSFSLVGDDPDGDVIGYGIEFGDGMSASGQSVTHAYYAPGTYFVRARVVDPFGLVGEDSVAVQVVAPTIGCMDPAASNYDPNANLPGDCTYGPVIIKTEEFVRIFVCNYEQGFVEYLTTDTWGRMYDYWSDGTRTPAGDPYRISITTEDRGPVTAAPYGLICETYNDDWP